MLAKRYSDDFFSIIPTKSRLMPYAEEVLSYLAPKYNLYILSNGFRELQSRKMRFALSATQSELRESLMIGDSWEADITGANGIGMHQAYYNVSGRADFPFRPTYLVTDLKELMELL